MKIVIGATVIGLEPHESIKYTGGDQTQNDLAIIGIETESRAEDLKTMLELCKVAHNYRPTPVAIDLVNVTFTVSFDPLDYYPQIVAS